MRVTALLLAAGHARRFGSDKRLLPVGNNQSLLEYTLSKYRQVFEQCVVVVREHDAAHDAIGKLPNIVIVPQRNSQAGMGDNIALAMPAILDSDAVAIALADMPLIQPQTLRQLRDQAQRDCIIYPQFENRRGHPVIFGSQFYSALSQLSGDEGARRVLSVHAQHVVNVVVDDAGTLADIDTPQDWDRIRLRLEPP